MFLFSLWLQMNETFQQPAKWHDGEFSWCLILAALWRLLSGSCKHRCWFVLTSTKTVYVVEIDRCRQRVCISHLFNILIFAFSSYDFSFCSFSHHIIHIFQFIMRTFPAFSQHVDDVILSAFSFVNKYSHLDTISTTFQWKTDACDELQSEKFITWICLRGHCPS